jgi:putative endonuclease
VDELVYYETGDDINLAIAREKQIKAGSRQDKIDLINSLNPAWQDLSDNF